MSQSEEFQRQVGARLSEARIRCGLTQAEVAERIGLDRVQTIGGWEAGKWNIAMGSLLALCDAYKVSVDWVLGRSVLPQLKGTGGILNLAVEHAIHGAKTWREVEDAARRLDVLGDGGILYGYEVPSEFEVLDDTEWETRRRALVLKLKRLAHDRGKPTRTPPRRV